MNDAQRYRMNAAECLSAAERCEPSYRGLMLAIAASWLSLARQQVAMNELLSIWSEASTHISAEPSRGRFHLALELRKSSNPPARSAAPPSPGEALRRRVFEIEHHQ
jgi:hypothetical protein